MRIIWGNQRFEAILTPGNTWASDLECVKIAGFKTDGPPSWTWSTSKASVLNKLRANRPPSGLTLTEVALQQYTTRNAQEEKKAEVKKQFEKAKKAAKKLSHDPSVSGLTPMVVPDGKFWISAEDLPPWVSLRKVSERILLTETLGRCIMCDELLYIYEGTTACLWCQKENENKA